MGDIRGFVRSHLGLVLVLLLATLAVRALVPAGMMLDVESRAITVTICADSSGQHLSQTIIIPMHAGHAADAHEHAKHDSVCPYSSLTLASLGGVDALLLAAALAFVLTLGFAPSRIAPLHAVHGQRPPVRGPPRLI